MKLMILTPIFINKPSILKQVNFLNLMTLSCGYSKDAFVLWRGTSFLKPPKNLEKLFVAIDSTLTSFLLQLLKRGPPTWDEGILALPTAAAEPHSHQATFAPSI